MRAGLLSGGKKCDAVRTSCPQDKLATGGSKLHLMAISTSTHHTATQRHTFCRKDTRRTHYFILYNNYYTASRFDFSRTCGGWCGEVRGEGRGSGVRCVYIALHHTRVPSQMATCHSAFNDGTRTICVRKALYIRDSKKVLYSLEHC